MWGGWSAPPLPNAPPPAAAPLPAAPVAAVPTAAPQQPMQYTAAQFAAMTPEQQYALQAHWQQWQKYQEEYAKWHAQYGEQYNREMAAATGVAATTATSQASVYPTAYTQPQPPLPPTDNNTPSAPIQAPTQTAVLPAPAPAVAISGQPQIYTQPPLPVVKTATQFQQQPPSQTNYSQPPPPFNVPAVNQPPPHQFNQPNFGNNSQPGGNFQSNNSSQPDNFNLRNSFGGPPNQFQNQRNSFCGPGGVGGNASNYTDNSWNSGPNKDDMNMSNQGKNQNFGNDNDNRWGNERGSGGNDDSNNDRNDPWQRDERGGSNQGNNWDKSDKPGNFNNDRSGGPNQGNMGNRWNDNRDSGNFNRGGSNNNRGGPNQDNFVPGNNRGGPFQGSVNNNNNWNDNRDSGNFNREVPNQGNMNNNWNDRRDSANFSRGGSNQSNWNNDGNFGPNRSGNPNFGSNQNQGNWGNRGGPTQGGQQNRAPELDEEGFDRLFRQWEQQFEDWKKANINNPDRVMYERYEQEFERQRRRLIERRDQMRRRKMEQMGGQGTPSSTHSSIQPQIENKNATIDAINQQETEHEKPAVEKSIDTADDTEAKDSSLNDSPVVKETRKRKSRFDTPTENKVIKPPTPPPAEVILLDDDDSDNEIEGHVEQASQDYEQPTAPISTLFKKTDGIPGLDLVDENSSSKKTDKEETNKPEEQNLETKTVTPVKKIPSLFDIVIQKPTDDPVISNIEQPLDDGKAKVTSNVEIALTTALPNIASSLKDPDFMKKITDALAKAQGKETADVNAQPPQTFIQQLPDLVQQLKSGQSNSQDNSKANMSFSEWQRQRGGGNSNIQDNINSNDAADLSDLNKSGSNDRFGPNFGPDNRSGPNFGGNFGPNGPNDNRCGANFGGRNDSNFGPNDGPNRFGPNNGPWDVAPFGNNEGPMGGRFGNNDGPMGARFGNNDGPIGGRFGNNDGPMGGRFGNNDGPMGGRFGNNDGPMGGRFGNNNGPMGGGRFGNNDGPMGGRFGNNDGPMGGGRFGNNDGPMGGRFGNNNGPMGGNFFNNDGPMSGRFGNNNGPMGGRFNNNDGPMGGRFGNNDGPMGGGRFGNNDGPMGGGRFGNNDGPMGGGHFGNNDGPMGGGRFGNNDGPMGDGRFGNNDGPMGGGRFGNNDGPMGGGGGGGRFGPQGRNFGGGGGGNSDNFGPNGPNNNNRNNQGGNQNNRNFGGSNSNRAGSENRGRFNRDDSPNVADKQKSTGNKSNNDKAPNNQNKDANRIKEDTAGDDKKDKSASNANNPFRRSGGPQVPIFDEPEQKKNSNNAPWISYPTIQPEPDEFYRPMKVIDYQNTSVAAKVIDYGHRPSANIAAAPASAGFGGTEFRPVKTFDYGHSSASNVIKSGPSQTKQTPAPPNSNSKRRNKRKNKNNNKNKNNQNANNQQDKNNANATSDQAKEPPAQTQQQQNQTQEESKPENNETATSATVVGEGEGEHEHQQQQNVDDVSNSHENTNEQIAEFEAISDTEDNLPDMDEELPDMDEDLPDMVEVRDDDSPPPPPPPIFSLNAPLIPSQQAKGSSIFPSTAAANENIKTTSAKHVQMGVPSFENQNTISIDEIIMNPGRQSRPKKICIILRGPPGSGKSYMARLIKEKECEMGGTNSRILSIDDYFLIENDYEEKCQKTGKMIPKKEILYEYDKEMEATYTQYLIKLFKKTIADNLYDFIIIDCNNSSMRTLNEFYCNSKETGFVPYIVDLICDFETCMNRNIHERTEKDIKEVLKNWNPTPFHYIKLDCSSLLENLVEMKDAEDMITEIIISDEEDFGNENVNQKGEESSEAATTEKQKQATAENAENVEEEVGEAGEDSNDAGEDPALSCAFLKSKWENDNTTDNLARLDGTNKFKDKRKAATMEDYLQIDGWEPPKTSKDGKKRVRWADIEEKRAQEKMRAIGFVVGQTDWKRMMDPNAGNRALNRTKFIERNNRRGRGRGNFRRF